MDPLGPLWIYDRSTSVTFALCRFPSPCPPGLSPRLPSTGKPLCPTHLPLSHFRCWCLLKGSWLAGTTRVTVYLLRLVLSVAARGKIQSRVGRRKGEGVVWRGRDWRAAAPSGSAPPILFGLAKWPGGETKAPPRCGGQLWGLGPGDGWGPETQRCPNLSPFGEDLQRPPEEAIPSRLVRTKQGGRPK